jgi:hypothetical protein
LVYDKFRKLSQFSNSGNDDEFFEYADDPVDEEIQRGGKRRLFAFSFYGAVLAIGGALGSSIVLNAGGGSDLEFGQGVTQIVNCQGTREVLVTPFAGFYNEEDGGNFTLDSIYIENIHKSCLGKDFIVKIFDNSTNNPLELSEANEGEIYEKFKSVRFHWVNHTTVTMMGTQYTDVEFVSDTSGGADGIDFNANETGFLVTFDAGSIEGFANASNVFKITLETAPHTGATS